MPRSFTTKRKRGGDRLKKSAAKVQEARLKKNFERQQEINRIISGVKGMSSDAYNSIKNVNFGIRDRINNAFTRKNNTGTDDNNVDNDDGNAVYDNGISNISNNNNTSNNTNNNNSNSNIHVDEVEVFHLTDTEFDRDKCYAFALKTRTEGKSPNAKHFSTNPLQYLGKYKKSDRWVAGNGSGGAEFFDDNGKENRIELDYGGKTCFREVPCQPTNEPRGGKKSRRKIRKNKRTKKNRNTRRKN
jgi:hypothetical protein